ncbi:hypothetical protein niasHT_005168 [Heterodera trifolii]|uniref:G-protein coupled receptors family 1 profile domain-containing protein n=1 Tax=Heterodera trifolii TaxID=157864 RepID=A0ABD2LTG7_9BILA
MNITALPFVSPPSVPRVDFPFQNGGLSAAAFSSLFGKVDHLFEFDGENRTLLLAESQLVDPGTLIHALRPFCAQKHVSDLAKLLAESVAKRPNKGGGWSRLLLTCIFSTVGFFGFMGNLLTVFVIFRTPSLHSHTNYFLASLAVSDLLLIFVGVSFDLFSLWRRHLNGWTAFSGFCEATSTSISWFTFCSILTIVGLTGERLVAICYPFSLRPYFYHRSMLWLIAVLWLISFFPSLYIGLQFKTVVRDFCGKTHSNVFGNCDFVGWDEKQQNGDDHLTFEAQLLLTFVFPVAFVIYCYIKILQTLNEATSNSHQLTAAQPKRSEKAAEGKGNRRQQQRLLAVGAPGGAPRESLPPSPDENLAERRFFVWSKHTANSTPRRKLTRNSSGRGSIRSQQAHKTVLKMLVTITILFFICYLPYHLERLVVKYARGYCARVCAILYPITGLLQYISATLNPIIYTVMSRRFRREFLHIFQKMCGREMTAEEDRNGDNRHQKQKNGEGGKTPLQMTPLNRLL